MRADSGGYHELFPDDAGKAAAFDEIAEHVYAGNFGQISKGDFEVLLFHIYVEKILERGDRDFRRYSDYTLARELGIPQSKVSNLKVRQQLQYPHEFDWKKSLLSITKNIRYDAGKIKIPIPDINLCLEIENAIREDGGIAERTLTRQLLQLSPEDFYELLLLASGSEEERNEIRENVREMLRKNSKAAEGLAGKSMRDKIKGYGRGGVIGFFKGLTECVPLSMRVILCAVVEAMERGG